MLTHRKIKLIKNFSKGGVKIKKLFWGYTERIVTPPKWNRGILCFYSPKYIKRHSILRQIANRFIK